ncbi:cell filamentation protein [Herbaspirillum rubrisubalbicans]|uniref:protein adenylyltransferase n=1 Tax=Herbaspirillum rubrisubalbicans TaxID=80842 RepID=A0ABX9C1B5_9BURK|nr:Fic family protein [Herbaspirillum rubrisubalbicans]RAM64195.1 cell filamentation protein [Herbaspirillum rubrisubalbicans]RAN49740.1 cell filamentation protein [Herbaspirillum rubrisubalbicans]
MFDPFGDFQSAGYLRNIEGLKDGDEIKVQEHLFFEANLETALDYLENVRGPLRYEHFMRVHRLLFGEFYPWAGQDRHMLGVGRLIGKGERLQFEAAELCQRAVEWGLHMGNDRKTMRTRPGAVMGAFAWGHPFLDGNGRTMLVVHSVLSHRAGITIDWRATRKQDYLAALTQELLHPQEQHLDRYLRPFIGSATPRSSLLEHLQAIDGLDGRNSRQQSDVAYGADDTTARRHYLDMKRSRGTTGQDNDD